MQDEFFEIVRQVLVPMFYKEAQLGRSLRRSNQEFKKDLLDSIIELANRADNSMLKNVDVRDKIKELSNRHSVSIGQSQKVINVFLKYYCVITKKSTETIRELDCPLDSEIIIKFKTKELRRNSLKEMNDFSEYVAWQDYLERIGKGFRLKPDIETYDKERLRSFLSE